MEHKENGASLIEYALLVSAIAIAVISSLRTAGKELECKYYANAAALGENVAGPGYCNQVNIDPGDGDGGGTSTPGSGGGSGTSTPGSGGGGTSTPGSGDGTSVPGGGGTTTPGWNTPF